MRMRRIALFTCTLFLVLTACAAQADEVVITLEGIPCWARARNGKTTPKPLTP